MRRSIMPPHVRARITASRRCSTRPYVSSVRRPETKRDGASHQRKVCVVTAPRQSTGRFVANLITGALASKVLGFAREIMMATVLGATLVADGFRGAITAVMLPISFLQNETVPAVMI